MNSLESSMLAGIRSLQSLDPELSSILESEAQRQTETLSLVASSGGTHPSVMAACASEVVNITAEGYPGKRFHGGCTYVDRIETLAIERAKSLFGAKYVNVQPHCASSANHIVMHAVLRPGDSILGLGLDAGGHLTHGAKANLSGSLYSAQSYGLTERGEIDFHEVQTIANESRPRLIICGTTAYSRRIDFSRFRRIADEVGALLLADITHIAGLVATGLHESPIDVAHITTTCTFKQLFGPRGGLIMMGESHQLPMNGGGTLTDRMQRAVFPMLQGAPAINIIAAKARALQRAASPEFSALAERIVNNADCLAQALGKMGYKIVTGGTDNHIVLCELESRLTGKIAQAALEECGIIVNKNRVPRDQRTASITSGIRLGSNTVALRRMGPSEMVLCAELIDDVLRNVESMGDSEYLLSSSVRERIQKETASLCRKFPLLH